MAYQAPLFMAFSMLEYWSGLPFPTSGDLPDPGIKPASLASSALAGGFFTAVPPAKPNLVICVYISFLFQIIFPYRLSQSIE